MNASAKGDDLEASDRFDLGAQVRDVERTAALARRMEFQDQQAVARGEIPGVFEDKPRLGALDITREVERLEPEPAHPTAKGRGGDTHDFASTGGG
jgi:hypothetical protein